VTEIIGRDGQKSVFDQTSNAAFNDPVVQAGVTQARVAIVAGGGPGTAITGPTLTSQTQATTTTTITADTARTSTMTSVAFFFGPQTIQIGDRGLCTFGGSSSGGVSSTGQLPSGCQTGTSFLVQRGTSDLNTNTNTDTQILRTTTLTDTVQTTARYDLVASLSSTPTPGPVPVPEPASMALLGAGLAGLLALRRRR